MLRRTRIKLFTRISSNAIKMQEKLLALDFLVVRWLISFHLTQVLLEVDRKALDLPTSKVKIYDLRNKI